MTVSAIDSQRLKKFIRKQRGRSLILDCRPFLSFAASHVHGSHSVNLNSVVVRRSRGGPIPLQFIVPDERARARLREGRVSTVVILDERTSQRQRLSKDSTAQSVLNTLTAVISTAKIYFLKGEIGMQIVRTFDILKRRGFLQFDTRNVFNSILTPTSPPLTATTTSSQIFRINQVSTVEAGRHRCSFGLRMCMFLE